MHCNSNPTKFKQWKSCSSRVMMLGRLIFVVVAFGSNACACPIVLSWNGGHFKSFKFLLIMLRSQQYLVRKSCNTSMAQTADNLLYKLLPMKRWNLNIRFMVLFVTLNIIFFSFVQFIPTWSQSVHIRQYHHEHCACSSYTDNYVYSVLWCTLILTTVCIVYFYVLWYWQLCIWCTLIVTTVCIVYFDSDNCVYSVLW